LNSVRGDSAVPLNLPMSTDGLPFVFTLTGLNLPLNSYPSGAYTCAMQGLMNECYEFHSYELTSKFAAGIGNLIRLVLSFHLLILHLTKY